MSPSRVKKVASLRMSSLNWAIAVWLAGVTLLVLNAGNHLKCCCLSFDELSTSPLEELHQTAEAAPPQQSDSVSAAPRVARDHGDHFESRPGRNIYAHHRHCHRHHQHQHERTLQDSSGNSEKVIRDNSNNNDNHNNGHRLRQRRQQQDREAAASSDGDSAAVLAPARDHGREWHRTRPMHSGGHNNRQSSANLARTTIAFPDQAGRNDELDDLRRPRQQQRQQQQGESSSGIENDQWRLASAPSDRHSSATGVTRRATFSPLTGLGAADNQEQDAQVDKRSNGGSSSSSDNDVGANDDAGQSNSLIESERAALDEPALGRPDGNEAKLAVGEPELSRPTTLSMSAGHYGAQAGASDHLTGPLRRFEPEPVEWASGQPDDSESVGAEEAPQLPLASPSSSFVECRQPGECPRGRHRRHFCGSDGCIYGSLCELRRASCRLGWTVTHMKGLAHCKRVQCATEREREGERERETAEETGTRATNTSASRPKTIIKAKTNGRVKIEQHQSDNYGDHLIAESSSSSSSRSNMQLARSHANDTEAHRGAPSGSGGADIKCTRREYRDFKLALWHEFNGNAQLMFKYLDLNANGLVEARELWPRGGGRRTQQQFSSSGRPLAESNHVEDGAGDNKTAASQLPINDRDEFAFRPHYLWNPCSLSHLMSFELSAQGDQFDLASLQRAFSNLGRPMQHQHQQGDGQKVLQARQTDTTSVLMQLGESRLLECLSSSLLADLGEAISSSASNSETVTSDDVACLWSRYSIDLGTVNDEHTELVRQRQQPDWLNNSAEAATVALHLKDAQLYLSGQYECTCQVDKLRKSFLHKYSVQVAAKPRVLVRPASQWSLPNSRVWFECHHDYIDTSPRLHFGDPLDANRATRLGADGYYKVDWLKVEDSDETAAATIVDSSELGGFGADLSQQGDRMSSLKRLRVANCSGRAAITTAASRLVLERLRANDTGQYKCRVRVSLPISTSLEGLKTTVKPLSELSSESQGHLLVQEQMKIFEPARAASGLLQSSTMAQEPAPALAVEVGNIGNDGLVDNNSNNNKRHLWLFHESGISVYKLTSEDGQELELVHELSGHSEVSGEVDGNWNQLTLCGGLSQEQVVICEWSDNAIEISVPIRSGDSGPGNSRQQDSYQLFDYNRSHNRQRKQRPYSAAGSGAIISKYIYIGQPNLNRVIVLDAGQFTIVAIVNTEPQPRKLFAFKPNKIHLNKWVRRRLSPLANARWLQAIERHNTAHPLELTPKSSRLYSDKRSYEHDDGSPNRRTGRQSGAGSGSGGPLLSPSRAWPRHGRQLAPNQEPPKLVQHDIWLLCYGQPLVVDPARDSGELQEEEEEQEEEEAIGSLNGIGQHHHQKQLRASSMNAPADGAGNYHLNSSEGHTNRAVKRVAGAAGPLGAPLVSTWPLFEPPAPLPYWPARVGGAEDDADSQSTEPGQHEDREARLRNRKSVQIIQSTFFTDRLVSPHNHTHDESADDGGAQSAARGANHADDIDDGTIQKSAWWSLGNSIGRPAPTSSETPQATLSTSSSPESRSVSEFKRLAVLTTHYVTAARSVGTLASASQASDAALDRMIISKPPVELGSASLLGPAAVRLVRSAVSVPSVGDNNHHHNHHSHHQQLSRRQFSPDLVQDLSVPARPHSLVDEGRFKLHYAYATHYNDRQLYRIAMDSYHYDKAIDLNDCDPISMLTAVQGLLIVQCRAHITHQLIGQLVLDELTSGKIQFNDNIRAQVAYLSPDSKYLISVYTGTTTTGPVALETRNSTTNNKEESEQKRQSTIIYVQLVGVNGLALQYEIKTSLEISQCSFVWKDGYYAAVFVALNRRDQQIELLSLRLADSRLELMVRVPGLVTTTTRHREALNILSDLKLASLSTTDGTYIVDLEENRVTQTLNYHHPHQSSPTLLWV